MHAVLSKLMASLLLVQSLSGWCCHRPGSANLALPMSQVIAGCPHCCQPRPAQPPAFPVKCQECFGVCTYVPPQKAQFDSPQLVVPANIVPAVVAADLSLASRNTQLGGPSELEPPLRLHLMHQILLV